MSPGATPPTPFHVVTVVWGRAYIELFLDVAVPNQLTPGNLGALPPGSRYRVLTTAEDLELLEASAALKQANDVIPVDLVVAPELSRVSDDQFVRLTAGHSRALRDAADSGAALIFLAPDHFMSEGTLAVSRDQAKLFSLSAPASGGSGRRSLQRCTHEAAFPRCPRASSLLSHSAIGMCPRAPTWSIASPDLGVL